VVSIVIPTYNGERWLARTLDSVQAQTVSDWELVVVDDGSKDRSAEIAADYASRDERIRLVRQANGGIGAARNRGWRATNGRRPYLMFLDHDDCWMPDTVATLLQAIESDLGAVAAFGAEQFVDDHGEPTGRIDWSPRRLGVVDGRPVAWSPDAPVPFNVLVFENCIWSPGQVIYRRSHVEAVGGFDPALAPCDDWDFHIRLSLHGPFVPVERAVLLSRQHDHNTSRNTDLMLATKRKVHRKLVRTDGLATGQRATLLAAIRLLELEIAAHRVGWARSELARHRPLRAIRQARHAALSYARVLRPTSI
jgi:glycosyltransferase involved in cell wall biosynthesis